MYSVMNKKECAACIIIYNPEIQRLYENIKSICEQVDVVYCYNNASNNTRDIINVISNFHNCEFIDSDINKGIATAINEVAKKAKIVGYSWLLTLDQDSVCPNNMVSDMLQYSSQPDIGIICPCYVDSRRNIEVLSQTEEVTQVDFCITSGSLMNLDVFFKINGMDDFLFVGSVDDEYCYRIIKNGYCILQINSVQMDHELGNIIQKKYGKIFLRIGNLLHSKKIQALSYKREVSPFRVYYATRNIIYLSEKYKNHPYKFSKMFAIVNGVSSILRSKQKAKVTKAFFQGMVDGFKSVQES